jgi:chaperonin GroES
MTSVRPLHDRVIARRLEGEEKTAGGIIIPDTAKEKPIQAEVIACGPGARDESGRVVAMEVRVGENRWRRSVGAQRERHHRYR